MVEVEVPALSHLSAGYRVGVVMGALAPMGNANRAGGRPLLLLLLLLPLLVVVAIKLVNAARKSSANKRMVLFCAVLHLVPKFFPAVM